MISSIASILSLEAFQARSDDPDTHFGEKVGKKQFIIAILGHQHIKFALATIQGKRCWLGKPTTSFCENFLTSDIDSPWVTELMNEIKGNRTLLLGLNIPFSLIKIYEKAQKLRDIQRLLDTKLELEVGKTFERQTRYFPCQILEQFCLNGVEKERITKPIEKFKKWGFDVVGAFHYPSAILSRLSLEPLDWTNPCILVYYHQRMLFFLGWNKQEIITLRSKLISEGARTATGSRPILNAIQKEIDTTVDFVEKRAGKPVTTIYSYHDRQDQVFAGIEGLYKNVKVIQWPTDGYDFELQPYPDPDLTTIFSHVKIATAAA